MKRREQSLDNQRGEVEFRKKVVRHQVAGVPQFSDEPNSEAIQGILRERMDQTLKDMQVLKERGTPLSPYVELGAERGQRSLVMENDLGACGAATDLSCHMLQSCQHYAGVFGREHLPLSVCCDAYHLPFLSDSIPFVFSYAMLHHFPDPSPIVQEVCRVLRPGGCFFFADEPYRKVLHLPLYTLKRSTMPRNKVQRLMNYFLGEQAGNEEDHGIVENRRIGIRVWRRALSPFYEKEVRIRSWIRNVESDLFRPEDRLRFYGASLMGGSLRGICRKAGNVSVKAAESIQEVLACPSCLERGRESRTAETGKKVQCVTCGRIFPIANGVLFLLSEQKMDALYPEVKEEG